MKHRAYFGRRVGGELQSVCIWQVMRRFVRTIVYAGRPEKPVFSWMPPSR